MYQGKATCEVLKEIRSQIAAQNEIEYEMSDCRFEGDCKGTCPKCEAELKFIEHQLIQRKKSGKSILISGITAGIITTLMSSCQEKPNAPIQKEITQKDTIQVDTNYRAVDTIKTKELNNSFDKMCFDKIYFGEIEMGEVVPEFIPSEIDIIEDIPDPFPIDSTNLKIDTL